MTVERSFTCQVDHDSSADAVQALRLWAVAREWTVLRTEKVEFAPHADGRRGWKITVRVRKDS